MEENEVLEYVESKLIEAGLKILPISEIYSKEDWEMAKKACKEENLLGIVHILAIGFANGFLHKSK